MDRDRIREVWHNSFEADLGLMWCFSSQAVMGVYRGLIHNKFIHSSATCIDTLFNLVLPSLPPPLRPCPLKHAAKRLLTQSSRLVEGRGQASSWRDVCVGCRPRCPETPQRMCITAQKKRRISMNVGRRWLFKHDWYKTGVLHIFKSAREPFENEIINEILGSKREIVFLTILLI